MANKKLFRSNKVIAPPADTKNSEGAPAYSMSAKHALAQMALTGCLNKTFYSSSEDQLETVLRLCQQVDINFIAKTAIYARQKGLMKDMPALLCAYIAAYEGKNPSFDNSKLFYRTFAEVCGGNIKMIRNFVQIIRSGITGRKSLGSLPKREIAGFLTSRTPEFLFQNSIGNDPSVADLIMLTHPKANDETRNAVFKYLLGREVAIETLPPVIQNYEKFKATQGLTEFPQGTPFRRLTSIPLDNRAWIQIAKHASWTETRMNLNTFERHGVFEDKEMTNFIIEKLRNPEEIKRSKVFPYQLLAAYMNTNNVPTGVTNALQDAMDIAIDNIPSFAGKTFIFCDISGSMYTPVTGESGKPTVVQCSDVAALMAAAMLRKNQEAVIIPFSDRLNEVKLNPKDSVMTNSKILYILPRGGTNCSLPLIYLNENNIKADNLIYVSDYESWLDRRGTDCDQSFYKTKMWNPAWVENRMHIATRTAEEWKKFSARNPNSKMICIDLQPNTTVQAMDDKNVLNIGGFSDTVFEVIKSFTEGSNEHLVDIIEKIDIYKAATYRDPPAAV